MESSDSNWQHFAITQVLASDEKVFSLALLHRHRPECHPKRDPDSSPCMLQRQPSEAGVRLPLLISSGWQSWFFCQFFKGDAKDTHVPNLMCWGGENTDGLQEVHDCSANRNNLFNGVMLILQWVVFFYHHLAHVYEIWWQWSIHNKMLWTTDARHTPSLSAELAVGVERKIQPPLPSLPFMNVTETILTLHKNQFFLCC